LIAASITLRAAHDVGLDGLNGLYFVMLEPALTLRMHDDGHPAKARSVTVWVAYIADKILRSDGQNRRLHVVLFEFIAAETTSPFG
jgi:hypothetical protein